MARTEVTEGSMFDKGDKEMDGCLGVPPLPQSYVQH